MPKLGNLPDKVILKVFGNLQFPDLLCKMRKCPRESEEYQMTKQFLKKLTSA